MRDHARSARLPRHASALMRVIRDICAARSARKHCKTSSPCVKRACCQARAMTPMAQTEIVETYFAAAIYATLLMPYLRHASAYHAATRARIARMLLTLFDFFVAPRQRLRCCHAQFIPYATSHFSRCLEPHACCPQARLRRAAFFACPARYA